MGSVKTQEGPDKDKERSQKGDNEWDRRGKEIRNEVKGVEGRNKDCKEEGIVEEGNKMAKEREVEIETIRHTNTKGGGWTKLTYGDRGLGRAYLTLTVPRWWLLVQTWPNLDGNEEKGVQKMGGSLCRTLNL